MVIFEESFGETVLGKHISKEFYVLVLPSCNIFQFKLMNVAMHQGYTEKACALLPTFTFQRSLKIMRIIFVLSGRKLKKKI